MRHQAIRTLYPSVVTIDHLGTYDKDGNAVAITESDVSAKQAALVIQAEADATAKDNRLASVKSKLEALGLTTEEVQDAFGL
jgi:hypothetical protein